MAKSKAQTPIERIDAIVELERVGWKFKPKGADELSLLCPAHDDQSPSVDFNTTKNLWFCNACKAKGDIITLLAFILKVDRQTVYHELATRYNLEITKVVNQEVVEKFHQKIYEAGPLLKSLRDRGITDDDIRYARLGYNDGRIQIPIYDENDNVIQIRKYLPGAPGPEKMKNMKGMSTLALYMPRQLQYPIVWFLGGEMKALVTRRLLNPHNIGATSATSSEGSWHVSWTARFKGKIVYICFDVDAHGLREARKIAAQIILEASAVYLVQLPLNREKYPKGDINDYVGSEGATDVDLLKCMEAAIKFVPDKTEFEEREEQIHDTKLIEAATSKHIGKRISLEAVVTGAMLPPFIIPKEVGIACDKNQPNCPYCPVKPMEQDETTGKVTLTVRGTSKGILQMVEAPERHQREALREALRIPSCKVATFTIINNYDVLDARLTPKLTISGDNSDHVIQPAFIVGSPYIDGNTPYRFAGRVYPHPKNQQAILLLDSISESEDSLTSYNPTPEELDELRCFRPAEWTVSGMQTKLDHYYTDIEANVTRIYQRRDLHLALDLIYHTVLYFNFDGQMQNGWGNVIIAGDSSQGKSEASMRLMGFYGLGERVEGKNSTKAGILGGLEQLGNRWFVQWGLIPMHDRRLLFMEEIKGMPDDVMGKLTDMRSSGVAQISGIEKRKAHARTRLVMISNPKTDGRTVASYNFGIEVIKELVGALEDIRRFDLALILSQNSIDSQEINKMSTERPVVEHTYQSELCRRCVLWAWTRKVEQVQFDADAERECLLASSELCSLFTDDFPLVDKGTMRFKIARLAVGLAARTFSTDDGETIIVRKCHVDYIHQFLLRLYSDPIFGYKDFSKASEYKNSVIDPEIISRQIKATKHPKDFVDHLLNRDEITITDIADWCEVDRDTSQKLLSLLVRKHGLNRVKRWYVKSSGFIALLKNLQTDGLPKTSDGGSKTEKF